MELLLILFNYKAIAFGVNYKSINVRWAFYNTLLSSRYTILSIKERDNIIHSLISEKNIATDFSLTDDKIHMIKKFDRSYISLRYLANIQKAFTKKMEIM